MVQVPRYSRQQVAVQPLGNVRQQIQVSPETFGAGQARALEHGGQQLQRAGAQLGQAAVNQQIRHNEATAKTAYANWQAEITPVLTEYEALQGQNAVGALEATRARIEEINTRILGGVQGDSAREMVEQQIQGRMPAIGAGLDRHYNRQLEVYETEASQARIGANIQQGIASPSTIPDMELEILAEVTQRGRDAGQADEVIRANALEYISSMHISVIDRLLAENGASVAAGHLATHGEKIVPSERVKVEARIERARKQEVVVARAQLSEGLKDEVASLRRTGRRAGVVSDAQILASYGMEDGGEIVASLNREVAFYEARATVATNSPEEDAALLESLRPEGEGFAEEAERYDLILKSQQDKYAALADDPSAYVLSSNPVVARAYEAARQDPRQLPAAIGVSLAEQERLGVPSWETRALPEGSASAVAAEFMAIQDPTRQANRVADLAALYGPHWPRVQGELVEAGLPGTTGVLAGMSAPTQAHARTVLAEAQHEGRPVLERAVGTEVKTDIDDQVREELADLQETLRGPGGVGVYETHREAVSLLALKYASAGANPSEAVKKAAGDVVNDQYQFVGTYRVPRGVDLSRVQATVARTESLVRQGGALPLGVDELTSLDPRLEPAEAQRQYAASLLASGYIVTNEDETGLVWVDEQGVPAAWPDGQRLEIRFDNLDLVSQGIGQDFDYMGVQ